jgi:hypothetical protein
MRRKNKKKDLLFDSIFDKFKCIIIEGRLMNS